MTEKKSDAGFMGKVGAIQAEGRDRFLKRIERFRFLEVVKIDKGLGQAAAFAKIFKKLGISPEDVAMVQESSVNYTRKVGEQFLASVARKNLDAMPLLSKSAHLAESVDYSGRGRALHLASIGVHRFGLGTEDYPSPPPAPQSQYIAPDSVYRDCHVHGEGYGDGVSWPWSSETGIGGQWCDIEYQFSFLPTLTTLYNLSAGVLAGGLYHLIANDGACDSKEARCDIQCYITVRQDLPAPIVVTPTITADKVEAQAGGYFFERSGQNILEDDTCVLATRLALPPTLLFANIEASVSVTIAVSAEARGGGSVADLNLARPTGAIACTGLSVE